MLTVMYMCSKRRLEVWITRDPAEETCLLVAPLKFAGVSPQHGNPTRTEKQTKEKCAANLIIYKTDGVEVEPGNPITKRKAQTPIGRRRNQLFGELCPLWAHVMRRGKLEENERTSSRREFPTNGKKERER